jgi:hypothetical protein
MTAHHFSDSTLGLVLSMDSASGPRIPTSDMVWGNVTQ